MTSRNYPLAGLALLLGIAQLAGCTAAWAQAIGDRVTDDLLALERYQGRSVELGALPGDPAGKLVRELVYEKPWRLRAETVEPAARKGDLVLFDGASLVMWWPKELVGVRVRGLPATSEDEVREHVRRETATGLAEYAYSLRGEGEVAGQRANHWLVIPTGEGPWRRRHEVWMHARHSFPLRVVFETPPAAPWYRFEFERLDLTEPVPPGSFAFEFPRNAVVFEYDLAAPGIPLEEARQLMNFPVLVPRWVHPGHTLEKAVRGAHQLPTLVLVLRRGASWLSLTEARAVGAEEPPPVGTPVKLGARQGWLTFTGSYALVSWRVGETQLSLLGNLAYPELLQVAASVEAP